MVLDFFSGRKKGQFGLEEKKADPMMQKVRTGTKSIIRKIQYDQLRNQGFGPREALKRLGIRLPIERRVTPFDVQKIVETGVVSKRRV